MDLRIKGTTRLLGVFGSPISHSVSPLMYNFCFDRFDLDMAYLAFECKEDGVEAAVNSIRTLNILGANVTMPCKTEFAKYMDKLSPVAELIGAVNTVVNENGVLTGHITDGLGVVNDLRDKGFDIKGKKVVILGAGGAATAIITQVAFDGAESISVFNRSLSGLDRVKKIGTMMQNKEIQCKMSYYGFDNPDILTKKIREADILINATSVGMAGVSLGESLIKDLSAFHKDLFVYDCIYNPQTTKLMEDAKVGNVPTDRISNGRGMLLWQGAAAFKLYTGLEMPVHDLMQYIESKENEKS